MVNWALAQTPDFLSAFNTGYDRGRTQAHDRGVQDALAQLDTNPQGAESALLRYGEVGAATMPFVFWEVKSENQPSANGQSTRPEEAAT